MRRAALVSIAMCAACADILGVHELTYVPGDGSTADSAIDGSSLPDGGDATTTDGMPSDGANEAAPDAGCVLCVGTITTPCALACTETQPRFLAVDATRLYWANSSGPTTLRSLVRPSGMPATFATVSPSPNAATASGAQYVFTDGTSLRAAALDGGVRTFAATPGANSVAGSPPQMAAPAVFWASSGVDAGIFRCALPDCTGQLLQIDKRMDPQGIAAVWDPNMSQPYGFWAEMGAAQHPILGGALVGGVAVMQYAAIATTTNVAAAEDLAHVWFTTYANGTSDLYKVGDGSPKFTTQGVVRGLGAGAGGVWLAIDDTQMSSNGKIVKFDGSNATFVAQQQDRPSSIALDTLYVYWTTLSGTVMRAGR